MADAGGLRDTLKVALVVASVALAPVWAVVTFALLQVQAGAESVTTTITVTPDGRVMEESSAGPSLLRAAVEAAVIVLAGVAVVGGPVMIAGLLRRTPRQTPAPEGAIVARATVRSVAASTGGGSAPMSAPTPERAPAPAPAATATPAAADVAEVKVPTRVSATDDDIDRLFRG